MVMDQSNCSMPQEFEVSGSKTSRVVMTHGSEVAPSDPISVRSNSYYDKKHSDKFLIGKNDTLDALIRASTPEALENIKLNHPGMYVGVILDKVELIVHELFKSKDNTEALDMFMHVLDLLKEAAEFNPTKRDHFVILADTYHQQFDYVNKSSERIYDYNFFPNDFKIEDISLKAATCYRDVEEDDEIPLYSFDPAYIRDKFCKFEGYKALFGKDSSYFEECVHAHIHLAVRLSECKSITSFFFHICDYFKDIVGISYGEFIREYERFIVVFMGTCLGVNVVYNMIPRSKRKSERTHMPVVQSGDSVSKYNWRRFLDQLKMFIRNKKRVFDSDFVNQFGNFCSLILCTPFCVKMGIDHTLFGYSEYYTRKMQYKYREKHVLGVSFEILEGAVYILDKITLYVETGDLTAFFIDDEEIAKYETKYLQLTEFKELPGAMANFGWSVDDYYRECDKCIEQGKKLQHFYAHDKVKMSALKVQQSMLARFKMKAYVKMQVESKREPPIGFCLYGPPSVGKSALIDKICHCLYENSRHIRKEGRKYDPNMKYMYNEDDEYFSEFKISKEVCVIDDVDQFKDDINLMKKGGGMAKAIYLINPIPYITNQAALEDKGMIPFMCKYVIATTNTYDAGISKIFRKHGGAYRRFYFIEVAVKPEYRATNSTQLRGDISEEGYKNHELHYFKFRKYVSMGSESCAFYWHKDRRTFVQTNEVPEMSFKDLSHVLYNEVQVPHYSQNDTTEKSVDDFLKRDFCEICCSVFCDCGEAQSGSVMPTAPPLIYNSWCYFGACAMFFVIFYIISLLIGYLLSTYYESMKHRKWFLNKLIGSYHFCWCRAVPNPMRNYVVRDYITLWLERQVRSVYNCGLVQHLSEYAVNARRHKYKIVILATLAAFAGVIYKTYRTFEPCAQSCEDKENVDPNKVAARKNVWKVNYRDLSVVDSAARNVTMDQLEKVVAGNVVHICATIKSGRRFFTNGLGYQSNLILVPKHWYISIKESFPCRVDILREDRDVSIGSNRFNVYLDHENFSDYPYGDVMVLQHTTLSPFRNIAKFLPTTVLQGAMEGKVIIRDEHGRVVVRHVKGFSQSPLCYKSDNTSFKYMGYKGFIDTPTEYGDCGAPYLVHCRNGVVIGGFHVAAQGDYGRYTTQVFACPLFEIVTSGKSFIAHSYNGLDLNSTYISESNLQVKPDIHMKCPLRSVPEGEAIVYGSVETHRRKMKTNVRETLMCDDVLDHFNLIEPLHVAPKGISSHTAAVNNLKPMLAKPNFPQRYVTRAEDALFNWYKSVIDENDIHIANGPLDLSSAINGVDGVAYMERMPPQTSGGFAHKGPKSKVFVELPPDEYHSLHYTFNDEVRKEYDAMLDKYRHGDRNNIVWDFNFKDEPLTHDKVSRQKCRVFNSGPVAFIALERQFFLWCIPLFSGKLRHKFGMAIGANCYSDDWKELYEYIVQHGIDKLIAGDYEKFDKSMAAQIMSSAFNVLIRLMKHYGWSDDDLMVAKGIATDIIFPLSNAFGTIIETEGSNPSGHSLTTIINGMVNIMYMMIATMIIEEERDEQIVNYNCFYNSLSVLTFGDDNCMSSKYEWLNHVSIATVLARYGVVYTAADKKSEIVPFINVDELEFLKRKFVLDTHGPGTVACPLAEESIIKMLTVVTYNGNITFDQQCAESILAANREYFQYGKEICEAKRVFLENLVTKYELHPYLPEGRLASYDEQHAELFN